MRFRCLPAVFTLLATLVCHAQAADAGPIDLGNGFSDGLGNAANVAQYDFLRPLLRDVDVVSLAESIHMTHEFPLARIGMVRWMNRNAGFGMFAIEGSPEDVWVSQDVFLHNPSDLAGSTSGIFDIWNTPEMKELFAYEASTWGTEHPLYITAYDVQPGTGRGSEGARVFDLLSQRLTQYAPAPEGFNVPEWSGKLKPLTNACAEFKESDAQGVTEAIAGLAGWIERAAPRVETAFPNLPHATALRLIPENLRGSLALCRGVLGAKYGSDLYKPTRDRNAAQFALRLKENAPRGKLILWAHVSHLNYEADGVAGTSVGELLHKELGPRLYTIGAFAGGGGAILLFDDWEGINGYGRVWGVSPALRRAVDTITPPCPEACFIDLRHSAAGSKADSAFSTRQTVWYEAEHAQMTLAADFDGVIWVRHVHPPAMTWTELLRYCSRPYWLRYWLTPIGVVCVCLLACWLVVRWWKRRKSRRVRG